MSILFFIVITGILHSLLPNHWTETPVLVRSYSMPLRKSILFFIITSVVHNLSTLVFALIVGVASIFFHNKIEYFSAIGSIILIVLGVYYIFSKNPKHTCVITGKTEAVISKKEFKRTYLLILTGLLFSPCLDIVFAFISAGEQLTKYTLLFIAILYFFISIIAMSSLMSLAYLGILKVRFHFIQKYFRKIMGILFILLVFCNYLHPYIDKAIEKLGNKIEYHPHHHHGKNKG